MYFLATSTQNNNYTCILNDLIFFNTKIDKFISTSFNVKVILDKNYNFLIVFNNIGIEM